MPIMDSHARRESIGSAIAVLAGPGAGAKATAQATLALWRRMAAQLEPVIGARGVDALFGRASHLAGKRYGWLAVDGARGGSATALDRLHQRLAAQNDVAAREAAQFLLSAFADLLATLVGDSLTARLLAPVWEPSRSNKQQEQAP